ncbi:hypothetical protein RGQ29_014111 [Quercus rubra]|uniref:NPH3 domain-containing protein n=1 Tax=Quercus rubra TaxID=3512 RepID=A0AAN7FQV1_QUERU|nr:hypothetical protein RGQ29_014111 [Quercus rubra]
MCRSLLDLECNIHFLRHTLARMQKKKYVWGTLEHRRLSQEAREHVMKNDQLPLKITT